MSNTIQLRRGKKSTFADTKKTTVLAAGEIFVEYQDGGIGKGPCAIKIGDGTTQYKDLPYTVDFNQNVEFITGTQTASTGAWTGISKSSVIENGKQIAYFLPYAGSGTATLNLTLSDGTTTGAKSIYRYGTSVVNTHYGANSIVRMTWVAAKNAWYVDGDYDSTINQRLRLANAVYAVTAITAKTIVVGTAAWYKQAASGIAFDISYPVLIAVSAIAAAKTGTECYFNYESLSAATTKSGFTGTAYSQLFLVGTLSGNTFTIDSDVLTTTIPTSADGKVYMPVGHMYNTTSFNFRSCSQLFGYYNGAFQAITPLALKSITNITRSGTTFTATRGDGTTFTFTQQDNNTTYPVVSTSANGLAPKVTATGGFLKGDGTWATPTNTTYPVVSTSANGLAPKVTSTANFLKGDGTWATPTNTTYGVATTAANGLMASADKIRANYTNIAYCTCATAAATAAKVINVSGNTSWTLTAGAIIVVKFSYTNSASNPTFNVNSTGAKSVWYNTALITTSNLGYAGTANRPMEFMYDGTQFVFIGWSIDSNTTYSNVSLGNGYGTCASAATLAAKTVTLGSYALSANGEVAVKFTHGPVASATLNINSKGAKAILDKGSAAKGPNSTACVGGGSWIAGDVVSFRYDGTNYIITGYDNFDFGDES